MYYSAKNHNIKQISNENNIWTEDSSVNSCYNCRDEFTLFFRKHHCRFCGKIFCYNCSKFFIDTNINSELIKLDNYLDECLNDTIIKKNKKRLCYQCNELLLNINLIAKFIKIFELLPINLCDIYKLLLVNKNWNKSIIFYLYKFKSIQYTINCNRINLKTYNIINNNKYYICGHNKLVTLYIIYTDWSNYDEIDLINIINNLQIRNTSCNNLLCNKNCEEKLNNYDIFYILNYTINSNLKKYLLNLLNITDITIYLPLFINFIKNDINDFYITDYIKIHCNNNIKLLIELFLQMFIIINNTKSIIYKNSLQKIKTYIKTNNIDLYNSIINSIKLIKQISNISIKNLIIDIHNINVFIKKYKVYIPLNNNSIVKSISSDIIIKDSNTKPFILEITFENNEKKKILFKKEDLRRDYIICKTILFIKEILNKENIENNLLIYEVLPINNESGLIEIVDNAYTLYDIKQTKESTLQNFILNNNKNETISIIKNRFINSLAIYCIITYILGIGDRHLDNIMVTKEGILFHIDFSFCLGYDPKPFYPSIRITRDMIDMIGGINSSDYNIFIEKCNKYYNCIRKYTNTVSLLLFLLNTIDSNIFNYNTIKLHIIKKFIYPESNTYAETTLNDTITNSCENYNYIDFLHYHSREKTVSKTVFNIYDTTISVPLYFKKYIYSLF